MARLVVLFLISACMKVVWTEEEDQGPVIPPSRCEGMSTTVKNCALSIIGHAGRSTFGFSIDIKYF